MTDQFQLCFCFCIGNKIGILTDNLLVATCFVLSLHSGISCSCRMIFQSSHFCVQDAEKLWFWMCLRQVAYQCCVIFACFFYAVLLVFSTAQWQLRHTGYSGWAWVFDYDSYRRTRACLLCIFMPPPTAHSTKLLTRALFIGPCHCSYKFISCQTFRVHVASDLNKTISFVASVLSTSFARALLGLIH